MDTRPLLILNPNPGIQRDGTTLTSDSYVDGQWVRFYNRKPRKMGGFKSLVEDLRHIPRGLFTFTKNNLNSIYFFTSNGVDLIQTDNNLTGTLSFDVSPATGFSPNEQYTWQSGAIYDSTGGGDNIIVAHPASNLNDISSSAETPVLYANAGDSTSNFASLSDGSAGTVSVSGGVCILQPYVFAYGNDGLIRNSNQNKPNDWVMSAGNDANEGNFAYTKIVKGLPMRGGSSSPSGLFWSLDSLISVTYAGGASVFNYDPVGATTVMSSNGFAEYDGYFFWMGIDRFFVYDGKVTELPNQTNINWVFDNLNFEQRQKVWATSVTRWGEIWWHFPFGQNQTECNRAVIYNVRDKVWYDVETRRGCGEPSKTLRYPIWCGNETASTGDYSSTVTMTIATPCVVTWTKHSLKVGDPVVLTTTGALPTGLNAGTTYYVLTTPTVSTFTLCTSPGGAAIATSGTQSGVHTATITDAPRYIAYGHEIGYNKVENGQEVAIESYVETSDFGFPASDPSSGTDVTGQDYFTRLTRVEPDFVQSGDLTLTVVGSEFARDSSPTATDYTFSPTTSKIDIREQRRMIRLKITSNEVDGFYEMGKLILHTEPGDIRP